MDSNVASYGIIGGLHQYSWISGHGVMFLRIRFVTCSHKNAFLTLSLVGAGRVSVVNVKLTAQTDDFLLVMIAL